MWRGRPKYKNTRVEFQGYSFPSKLERDCFLMLKAREDAGEIRDLRNQHTVHMTKADITWRIDFSFVCSTTGVTEFAEAKGLETQDYKLKLKLYRFYGPGPLSIYKASHRGIYLAERVIPTNGE